MSDWLRNILNDVEQRAAQRPQWAKSEYAQDEIARLRDSQSKLGTRSESKPGRHDTDGVHVDVDPTHDTDSVNVETSTIPEVEKAPL